MREVMLFTTIITLIFLFCHTLDAKAECPATSVIIRDSYFTVSNDEVDANTAGMSCSSSGGSLAKIENEATRSRLTEILDNKWNIQNLQKVWQFKKDGYLYRYIKADTLPSHGGWTLDDELPSFFLYKKNWLMYNKTMWFGKDAKLEPTKWVVYKDKTDVVPYFAGWYSDFILYGGSENTPGVKKLYRFHKKDVWSSKLSSFNHSNDENLILTDEVIHIPDFHVYIGARSNVNEIDWTWNDGSNVNVLLLDKSNASVCKQMSWHYDDEWKLLPMDCSSSRAFYICQYKFSVNVTHDNCNGTVLHLSWDPKLFKGLFPSESQLEATINEYRSIETNVSDGQLTMSGLQQRTNYTIKVTAVSSDCKSFNVRTVVSRRTSYGVPDDVESAMVDVNVTDACVVQWTHNHERITAYKISAYSNKTILIDTFIKNVTGEILDDVKMNRISEKRISFDKFLRDSNITFKIIAVSCAGRSQPVAVAGYCVIPKIEEVNEPYTSSAEMNVIPIIVGLLAGLLCLAIIAGIIFTYKRRKSHSFYGHREPQFDSVHEAVNEDRNSHLFANGTQDAPHQPITDMEKQEEQAATSASSSLETPSAAPYRLPSKGGSKKKVKAADLEIYLAKGMENDMKLFQEQFQEILNMVVTKPHEAAKNPLNKVKNRYKNIFPYDDSRVILEGGPQNDYINAAYIQGYKEKKLFIASQGPKNKTLSDFWRMIWEKNCSTIVMLCDTIENEKIKCEQYWPPKTMKLTFGDIEVQAASENAFAGSIQRKFHVSSTTYTEHRTVVQYQYIDWPDHGVPDDTTSMISLRRMVNDSAAESEARPIVVHCSAGAGRTGTFIAMDVLFDELDDSGEVDVQGFVMKMRESRKDMVQTMDQYIFIHKLLVEHRKMLSNNPAALGNSTYMNYKQETCYENFQPLQT